MATHQEFTPLDFQYEVSVSSLENPVQVIERNLTINCMGSVHLMQHRRGYSRQLRVGHLDIAQAAWHLELADELGDAIGAFVRAQTGILLIETDPESFRDGAETLGRNFRHEAHRMRQRDARGKAMRHIPRRPD